MRRFENAPRMTKEENPSPNHVSVEDNIEYVVEEQVERPTKFSPDWPPKQGQKPLPNLYTRCAKTFKKVKWPPEDPDAEPEVEPPPALQLMDEIQLNENAMFQKPELKNYKLHPGVYVEEPAELPEDVWPPPEPINTNERTIYDPSRKKRVIRDYTVFFDKNKAADAAPSYKVPPGTLHVYTKRGVLEFDTPELGTGRPKDDEPI